MRDVEHWENKNNGGSFTKKMSKFDKNLEAIIIREARKISDPSQIVRKYIRREK